MPTSLLVSGALRRRHGGLELSVHFGPFEQAVEEGAWLDARLPPLVGAVALGTQGVGDAVSQHDVVVGLATSQSLHSVYNPTNRKMRTVRKIVRSKKLRLFPQIHSGSKHAWV